MKGFGRLLPLMMIMICLLAVRIGGCQLFPGMPNQTSIPSTSEITPSPDATTSDQTGTESTTTDQATTAVTTTYASTGPLSDNNSSLGWSFIYADPPGEDKPTSIPGDIRDLVDKYNVVWQAPQSGSKVVYLTFDQGYEFNDNTARILDIAREKDVPMTFFILGSYLDSNKELILRMVNEGHLVANHSYSHPDTVEMLDKKGSEAVMQDVHRLEDAYRDLTGQEMAKYYRPPSGTYSEQLLDLMTREGYCNVFWGFAYKDWLTDDQPDPAAAKAKILGQLHDGAIILLHSVSNTNTDLMPELIDEIRARGYEFARIDMR